MIKTNTYILKVYIGIEETNACECRPGLTGGGIGSA